MYQFYEHSHSVVKFGNMAM